MPLTAVSSATRASSSSSPRRSSSSSPATTCSASERRVTVLARDRPTLVRRSSGSSARTSAGVGGRPPKRASRRPWIARAAMTDSCWPQMTRSRAPYGAPVAVRTGSGPSSSSSRARTGAARRRCRAAWSTGTRPPLAERGADGQRLAVQRVERALQRGVDAREGRRVALGPGRGLGRAQPLDEVQERAGVVGVEGHDELLVVEAERVGRVVVDRRVLAADLDVLLHDPPALLRIEPVPGARLDERVDEEVLALEAPRHRALLVAVLRRLAQAQERVGLGGPLHQAALGQDDVELVDAVEVLGL